MHLSDDRSVVNNAPGVWHWRRFVPANKTKLVDKQHARQELACMRDAFDEQRNCRQEQHKA